MDWPISLMLFPALVSSWRSWVGSGEAVLGPLTTPLELAALVHKHHSALLPVVFGLSQLFTCAFIDSFYNFLLGLSLTPMLASFLWLWQDSQNKHFLRYKGSLWLAVSEVQSVVAWSCWGVVPHSTSVALSVVPVRRVEREGDDEVLRAPSKAWCSVVWLLPLDPHLLMAPPPPSSTTGWWPCL